MNKLNRFLAGTGYQMYQLKSRVKVTNEERELVRYARSFKKALSDIIPECAKRGEIDQIIKENSYLELTDEIKKELVEEAQQVWQEIVYDYLDGCKNHTCDEDEAQSAVGDRMGLWNRDSKWKDISHADHEVVLKAAITGQQSV